MDRYRVIESMAKQHHWTHGCELGVWMGVTTFWLMNNTDLHMTCVDSWEHQPDNPEYAWQYEQIPPGSRAKQFTPWDHTANEQHFRSRAKPWGDRIHTIKGRAMAVLDQVADDSLDFIFHDGDHSHPYVAQEIRAWAPKLKPTGWHIGDDHNWDTVRDSVEEVFNTDYTVTGKDVWRAPRYCG